MLKRRILSSCIVLAALAGCQESDPTKINNSLPTADKSQAEAAGAGEVQGKTGGPTTAGPNNVKPGQMPPGYPAPDNGSAPADAKGKQEESKAADAPKTSALSAEELDAIKKLPTAEQAIALKQVVCLVSGENLGGMGMPLKVELDGKVGFLCCKGCKADYDMDPAAAFAKLPKK